MLTLAEVTIDDFLELRFAEETMSDPVDGRCETRDGGRNNDAIRTQHS